MTLPFERTHSLINTREFLRDLLDPKKTPRIPKLIRRRAYHCLRHLPHPYEILRAAKSSPDIFGMVDYEPENYMPVSSRKNAESGKKKK